MEEQEEKPIEYKSGALCTDMKNKGGRAVCSACTQDDCLDMCRGGGAGKATQDTRTHTQAHA
jgi:hypothetical protein